MAIVTPEGRVSVIPTWLSAALMSLLWIVMVNVLVCPTQIVFVLKALLKDGGATASTSRVELDGEALVTWIVPVGSVACNASAGMRLT